jgi:hypothetical protein
LNGFDVGFSVQCGVEAPPLNSPYWKGNKGCKEAPALVSPLGPSQGKGELDANLNKWDWLSGGATSLVVGSDIYSMDKQNRLAYHLTLIEERHPIKMLMMGRPGAGSQHTTTAVLWDFTQLASQLTTN